ncbi:ANKRD50 [Symbiodinium sp. CCMP2592]|nr:ANKRD50 [Symbiodinium sp. CCMP2592]
MLRIWSAMSGKELASIPAEKVDDVRALKLLLHSEHGLPPRFRQRLVYLNSVSDGVLDDFVKLDSPMDLQLVLIPYVQSSQTDADKLAAAAADGSLSEVEAKLQKPQDPNLVDSRGNSALGLAADRDRTDVVFLLLDVNLALNGFILTFASSRGAVELLRLLLNARADPNKASPDGSTALFAAAQKGHVEIVGKLLDAGADKSIMSFAAKDAGRTCLMVAAESGHADVVRMLLESEEDTKTRKLNTDFANAAKFTAMMYASARGHAGVVHLLLDFGANVNFSSKGGRSALMCASLAGKSAVVRLLLNSGADVNLSSHGGSNALMLASSAGEIEVVRLLLESGARANLASDAGSTALMHASAQGHVAVVQLLLQFGIDKIIVNNAGSTARMLARLRGHSEVERLLLDDQVKWRFAAPSRGNRAC